MADKKIIYEVEVDTSNADASIGGLSDAVDQNVESLRDLKQALREAKDAQAQALEQFGASSEQFLEASKRAGVLKDRINDINESAAAFAGGSKFEVFGNTLGQVTGKLRDLDFSGAAESAKNLAQQSGKIKFGEAVKGAKDLGSTFLSIGRALLANPLFLIVGTVVAIGAAAVALRDKIKPLAAAFDFLGGIIDTVVQAGKDFLDFVGLATFAQDELTAKTVEGADKMSKAIEARYTREIALAKAAGEDTFRLEQEKLQALLDANKRAIDALEEKKKRAGELNEDELKDLEERLDKQEKLQTDYDANVIARATKAREAAAKAEETARKEQEAKARAAAEKRIADERKLGEQVREEREEQELAAIADAEQRDIKRLEFEKKRRNEEIRATTASNSVKNQALKASDDQFQRERAAVEEKYRKEREEKDRAAREKAEQERREANEKLEAELKRLAEGAADAEVQAYQRLVDASQQRLEDVKKTAPFFVKAVQAIDDQTIAYRRELLKKQREQELLDENLTGAQKEAINAKYRALDEQLTRESEQRKLQNKLDAAQSAVNVAQQGAEAISSINNLLAQLDENRVRKGEKTSLEAQKSQFRRTKALSLVNAGINTAQAILQAIAQFGPPPSPLGIAGIASASVIGAAQIAAIAAKKFDGGDSGTGGAGPTPSLGNLSAGASQPVYRPMTPQVVVSQPGAQRVYVVESDITNTQRRVANVRDASSF